MIARLGLEGILAVAATVLAATASRRVGGAGPVFWLWHTPSGRPSAECLTGHDALGAATSL